MWSTVLEFRRPNNYELVHFKLTSVQNLEPSVEFGVYGEIAITYSSAVATAAQATKDAIRKIAFLMLEAKLSLEPYSIRTYPSTATPTPRLAGASEIADILGVSKSRVSQLSRSPGFPPPIALLSMGPVYTEQAILDYKKFRDEHVERRSLRQLNRAKARLAGEP